MRARFISTSPPGSLMLQISVAQLYDDNRDKLGFAWIGGKTGGATKLWRDSTGVAALVGHLNLIHPNRIQVLGNHEIAHLAAFEEAELFRMLRSEEHTSELQSQSNLVCRLLLEKKKNI